MAIIVEKTEGGWQRWQGTTHVNAVKAAKLIDDGVWSEADLAPYNVVLAVPFEIPEGKVIKRPVVETFEEIGGTVQQVLETEDAPRRMVRKSVILSRLTNEQIETAIALMSASQAERWRASDKPSVYFDDPETLAVLRAIDADPDIVMREGDDP